MRPGDDGLRPVDHAQEERREARTRRRGSTIELDHAAAPREQRDERHDDVQEVGLDAAAWMTRSRPRNARPRASAGAGHASRTGSGAWLSKRCPAPGRAAAGAAGARRAERPSGRARRASAANDEAVYCMRGVGRGVAAVPRRRRGAPGAVHATATTRREREDRRGGAAAERRARPGPRRRPSRRGRATEAACRDAAERAPRRSARGRSRRTRARAPPSGPAWKAPRPSVAAAAPALRGVAEEHDAERPSRSTPRRARR